jgi:hypothetical protein
MRGFDADKFLAVSSKRRPKHFCVETYLWFLRPYAILKTAPVRRFRETSSRREELILSPEGYWIVDRFLCPLRE